MGFEWIRDKINKRCEERQAILNSKELERCGINRKIPQILGECEENGGKESAVPPDERKYGAGTVTGGFT